MGPAWCGCQDADDGNDVLQTRMPHGRFWRLWHVKVRKAESGGSGLSLLEFGAIKVGYATSKYREIPAVFDHRILS